MRAQMQALHARWLSSWHARDARERLIIGVCVLLLVVVLAVWMMVALDRARNALRAGAMTELRERAGLLDRQAAEYERLRAAPKVTPSQTDLRALVQAQAGAAGLSRAVQSIDAADADHVKITLGAVAFADWLGLLVNLEAQQVRVESCRIEALSTPGVVSINAALVRPGRQ